MSLCETGTDGEDSGTLNLPSVAMALDAVVWSCVSYVLHVYYTIIYVLYMYVYVYTCVCVCVKCHQCDGVSY